MRLITPGNPYPSYHDFYIFSLILGAMFSIGILMVLVGWGIGAFEKNKNLPGLISHGFASIGGVVTSFASLVFFPTALIVSFSCFLFPYFKVLDALGVIGVVIRSVLIMLCVGLALPTAMLGLGSLLTCRSQTWRRKFFPGLVGGFFLLFFAVSLVDVCCVGSP